MENVEYFEDRAFWIIYDDGIRAVKGEPRDEAEVKGIHSYVGGV